MLCCELNRSPGGERWYAVHIRANAENLAAANLRRQGFSVFLPVMERTIRHARQFRRVRSPLFPGYGFVRMNTGRERWRSINGTRGVVGLVLNGSEPCAVPPGVVETLLDLSTPHGVVRFDHSLSRGQRVKMIAGPFVNQIGTLETLDGGGRVRVILEMMGAFVAIVSPVAELAPL